MEIIYDGNSTLKLHYLSGCNILGAVGDENSNKGKSLPFENERMNCRYIYNSVTSSGNYNKNLSS